LAEVERQVAALRDRSVLRQASASSARPRHLFGRLQVELPRSRTASASGRPSSSRSGCRGALVRSRVPGLEVVRVVGAHDRRPIVLPMSIVAAVTAAARRGRGLGISMRVVVAAEDLLVTSRRWRGRGRSSGGEEARDLGLRHPRVQQPPGVGREAAPGPRAACSIALEVGRGTADQFAVAGGSRTSTVRWFAPS